MDKKCKDIQELLTEYLDESLQEKDSIEIEQHIKNCKECGKVLDDLCKTINMVKNLPKYAAPNIMLVNINKKIQERKTFLQKILPVGFKLSMGSIAIAATVLIVIQLNKNMSVNEYQYFSKKEKTFKQIEPRSGKNA